MHMQFEFSFLMWAHNCPSKNQRTPNKNHHEKPSFELLLRIVQETSKHKAHRLLLLPSVACPGGRLPVAEDITCTSDLGSRGPRDGTDLNACFLGTSFHGTNRCYTSFQRRKATNSPTQLYLGTATTTSMAQ